jgi:hypothetical protein
LGARLAPSAGGRFPKKGEEAHIGYTEEADPLEGAVAIAAVASDSLPKRLNKKAYIANFAPITVALPRCLPCGGQYTPADGK